MVLLQKGRCAMALFAKVLDFKKFDFRPQQQGGTCLFLLALNEIEDINDSTRYVLYQWCSHAEDPHQMGITYYNLDCAENNFSKEKNSKFSLAGYTTDASWLSSVAHITYDADHIPPTGWILVPSPAEYAHAQSLKRLADCYSALIPAASSA